MVLRIVKRNFVLIHCSGKFLRKPILDTQTFYEPAHTGPRTEDQGNKNEGPGIPWAMGITKISNGIPWGRTPRRLRQ